MRKNFYKNIKIILILILVSNLMMGCTSIDNSLIKSDLKSEEKVLNYDKVKNSIIRFHVIANSDSENDQNLKLKVKNKVIEYLYDKLNKCKSLNESREVLKENMGEVQKIADDVVKKDNYNYSTNVELGRENFPEKSYGNIVLPQGNYEAFRIVIGDGEGKNWWCVMFPPLCFVDESKAEVQYDETEERLEKEIDKDSACEEKDKEEKDNVEIKFKIVEVIQDLFK